MRVDRVSRVIAASRERIFGALIDPAAVQRWLPPSGARGILDAFEPWPGGAFRMTLIFDESTETKRKTSENSDTVHGKFIEVEPPELIKQQFTFVSEDLQFAGTMVMTWCLAESAGGTRVTVSARDIPAGIRREEHLAGMASSLANLAAIVDTGPGGMSLRP